jgi:cytosine/adenosine deaminase-related metal-dependent hydrolase
MRMKKFAADFAFTLDGSAKPVERPLVVTDEAGKILSVSQYSQDELSDTEYHEGILIPGMVNAHCHIELSHLKGAFRQATGMSGFIYQINELRESVDEKGRFEAMKGEFENFSRQGVVAVSDISNCNESFPLKKEYRDKVYYRTFVELFGTEKAEAEAILEGGQRTADQATAMGLEASVTPHSCYTMSPKLLEITAKRGLESGIISYHSQESQEEEDMIMKGSGALSDNYHGRGLSTPPVTGTTALEYFIDRIAEKKGKVKGRINLVHNVVISQRSIDRAKEALQSPFFTICPLSNIFIHRQLPPIDLMRKNNLKICIGTDSLSSNLILDMVREMECLQENFPGLELGEILVWACTNGAELLGKQDSLGSIEKGKTPGIVLLENAEGFRLNENSKSTRLI